MARSAPSDRRAANLSILANVQISLDLALLTWLIHFSGGIVNPVIVFFVFHMMIASILLSNRNAYLQATFASLIFGLVMGGEQGGSCRTSRFPASSPLRALCRVWRSFSSATAPSSQRSLSSSICALPS